MRTSGIILGVVGVRMIPHWMLPWVLGILVSGVVWYLVVMPAWENWIIKTNRKEKT